MKLFNRHMSFLAGMFAGCGLAVVALAVWLWGCVSFQPYGEIVFTDFPTGVNTITMESDLVSISTTDFTSYRDVPFEPNVRVIYKDPDYGEIWGAPWGNHFYFEYENARQGRQNTAPINNIHGIHPTTKIQASRTPKIGLGDSPEPIRCWTSPGGEAGGSLRGMRFQFTTQNQ